MIYGDFIGPGRRKNKANQSQYAGDVEAVRAIPIPIHDYRDEAATQGKLKKQSQFIKGQHGVMLVMIKTYGIVGGLRQ
jgi:hypothetical protein